MNPKAMKSDSGTIAPLIAIYLALILLVVLGTSAVGVSLIAKNRILGVTDSAVLFGHDQSVVRGIPQEGALGAQVEIFLESAPSAKRIQLVSARSWVQGEKSSLELCARFINLFGVGISSGVICATSSAQSFIVED
ncbi:MAG: hypothetical protein K9G13_02090 [Aquiluna sp.]|nr:hypothetical protein [Aquiluna sp.]MCF8545315.1 hypothetical protein [Aquiluna sp.]